MPRKHGRNWLFGPGWFAAFGHQQDTSVLPWEDLPLAHHGTPLPEGTGGVPAAPAHRRSHRRAGGLLQAGTGTLLTPQCQVTDEHGAATALIPVRQREAEDSVSGRSLVSKCQHFSIPVRLACTAAHSGAGQSPWDTGPGGRRPAATSTFNC